MDYHTYVSPFKVQLEFRHVTKVHSQVFAKVFLLSCKLFYFTVCQSEWGNSNHAVELMENGHFSQIA
jgi:hypothetical protein